MKRSASSATVRGMKFASLPIPPVAASRAWEKVVPGGRDDCWLWPGAPGSHGYGTIGWTDDDGCRHVTTAHRAVWVHLNGPIPAGMTVDHVCRVRMCVNPSHLRLLSNESNARDNGQGDKTHCPKGHPYSGDNLYVDGNGHRRCRTCAGARFGRGPSKPRQPAKCGTPSGYKAHRRVGEPACESCRAANTAYYRQRRDTATLRRRAA